MTLAKAIVGALAAVSVLLFMVAVPLAAGVTLAGALAIEATIIGCVAGVLAMVLFV